MENYVTQKVDIYLKSNHNQPITRLPHPLISERGSQGQLVAFVEEADGDRVKVVLGSEHCEHYSERDAPFTNDPEFWW